MAAPWSGDALVFEEVAGLVRMELLEQGSDRHRREPRRAAAARVGDAVAPEVVAQACAIDVDDIETRHHQPLHRELRRTVHSRGIEGAACARDGAAARRRLRPASAAGRRDRHSPLCPGGRGRGEGADIHCRMFAPLHGIPEDPATGSANVALIGLLAKLRPEPDLQLAKKIAQGVDMGRPSLLEARAEKTAGMVTATYIGGTCVPVMRGMLDLA